MLSRAANRVKRRSVQQNPLTSPNQQQQLGVDIAPELLRWSDFSTPFPSVSMGGYSRFYATRIIPESSTELLDFCPLLSRYFEPSLPAEIPPKSPLFATLQRRFLPVIREASLESLTLNMPRNLTISTSATQPQPHPLKRRGRRLLRTPSIERDFVQGRYQSPSNTVTISELGATSLTDIAPSPPSTCSSDDSDLSHARSDSNDSEFPITPSTGIDSENDERFSTVRLDKLSPHHEFESAMVRSVNSTTFCTANTGI